MKNYVLIRRFCNSLQKQKCMFAVGGGFMQHGQPGCHETVGSPGYMRPERTDAGGNDRQDQGFAGMRRWRNGKVGDKKEGDAVMKLVGAKR
jgi:hypothetical protein